MRHWHQHSGGQLCAANVLLEIIEHPGARQVSLDIDTTSPASGIVLVAPQDAETNSVFARLALARAGNALRAVDDQIDPARSPNCAVTGTTDGGLDDPAGTGLLASLTMASELVNFYREGLETAIRAAHHVARTSAAVSDAAYSRATDPREASEAILATEASRSTAGHVLMGGALGLPALGGTSGIAAEGFFTLGRLSGDAQRGVELFRAAAVDPDQIKSTTITLDQLVAGGGPVSTSGSLRWRLGWMHDRVALRNATSAATVYELLGVSSRGFADARQFLREELRAFDRSRSAVLAAEQLPGDGGTTADQGITLYASVRVPPTQLPSSYWAAMLRYDDTPPVITGGSTTYASPPTWTYRPETSGNLTTGHTFGTESVSSGAAIGMRSITSIFDEAIGRAPFILDRLEVCTGCTTTQRALIRPARDALAQLVANYTSGALSESSGLGTSTGGYEATPFAGRARACWFGSSDVRVDVQPSSPLITASQLFVVRGRDGLECAIRGTLDGAPCSSATWSSLVAPVTFSSVTGPTAATAYTTRLINEPITQRPAPDSISIFVVRRISGTGALQPGQSEQLTGFVLAKPSSGTGYRYCVSNAIVPQLEREAADLIQPSTVVPRRPAVSCAGVPTDQRIPLENELTSDGDPVESSWRHYLDRARTAAAEADGLGEEVIRTGLEMDLRAEQASDELSRLCGVTINLTSIASTMAADTSTPAVGGTAPCTAPYVAQEGRCILDPILYAVSRSGANPDMARLASCIGADIVPYATLGNQTLCAWDTDPAIPGGLCEGAPEGQECPYLAEADGSCHAVSTFTVFAIDERIGIFERPDDIPSNPPDPTSFPCADIARMRAGTAGLQSGLRVLADPFLSYDGFREQAGRLGVEALVGGYVSVRYGNSAVFRTGSVRTGSVTSWPMGSTIPTGASCPTSMTADMDPQGQDGPLFCMRNLGSASVAARDRANDLLIRAVLAARVYAGVGFDGILLPYYPATTADCFGANEGTFPWDPLMTNVSCAPTGQFVWDTQACGDGDGEHSIDLADLGAQACVVDATPVMTAGCPDTTGAEWVRRSYDGSAFEVFDDRTDCDDGTLGMFSGFGCTPGAFCRSSTSPTGWDHNVPFVARQVDDELEIPSARRTLQRLYPLGMYMLLARASSMSLAERQSPPIVQDEAGINVDLLELTELFREGTCDTRRYEASCSDGHSRMRAQGNRAFPGDGELTANDLLNGIELACVAAQQVIPVVETNCDDPGTIEDLADAFRTSAFLECQANEMSADGANTIIANLPRRVVDALRRDGTALYGEGAGEFDAQVREIRAALIELSNARRGAATDLRAFSTRLRALRSLVAQSNRAREIEELSMLGRTMARMADCAAAIASTATVDPAKVAANAAAAGITCGDGIAQSFIDADIYRLRDANVDDDLIVQFSNFENETVRTSQQLGERATSIRAALERIDAALSRLRGTQTAARRALAEALFLDSDGTSAHFAVNQVFRARYNTLLQRYVRAHERAVRTAFIARLALEQRLGMPLAEIQDDVFSDEPPSAWVDTICTLPTIDYDSLRGGTPSAMGERDDDPSLLATPVDYSGAFVGDYVRRLEDVFESYSFVYPFQAGTDTAIVSLRDDVFRSRAPCDVGSTSLLFNGGRLDMMEGSDRAGWRVAGCNPAAVPPSTTTHPARQCVSVLRLDDPDGSLTGPPVSSSVTDLGRPVPYRITFGETPATTTTAARLEQAVHLNRGRYRVSWYGRFVSGGSGVLPENVVALVDSSGNALSRSPVYSDLAANGFIRYWFFRDVPAAEDVAVAITYSGSSTIATEVVDVAGLMVEDVTGDIVGDPSTIVTVPGDVGHPMTRGRFSAPPPFLDVDDDALRELRACRDDTGFYFRREAWTRGCARTCLDGYDGDCPPEWEARRCYWETSFTADSDTLRTLLLQGDAGFAAGNYNYRIDSLAVNLVGTGLRDCSASGGSAGCFASGNVSFSLMHHGPFLVRNALGALYEAPIFAGRIESARALAAERYLTNPLSSADRGLIEPYTRVEMRGRPLAGTMTLRVWDDGGLVFANVEDVQVVLNYRYWTHQR